MNPRLKLVDKILSGEKKIESRWSKNKSAPWGKVSAGDKIYFKDAGKPVTAMAEVENVKELTDMNKAIEIFGSDEWATGKNYCVLVFLKRPEWVVPFRINKKGFGSAAAWLCVESIAKIRVQ
ncbi:MAG: hypothetical protein G01um101416_869 [Microgenomates group bacterium Gr01-1014_16]|nr:MAG: hypothetical protein G01um101416_869 [Microgenomates group bacterium Gr01-1014_16]